MITVPSVSGKNYAVLGLGLSGLATAESLRTSGADVAVWDDAEVSRAKAEQAKFRVEDFSNADLSRYEALVLSPGIPHSFPIPHPIVTLFKAAHKAIIGDIDLLFQACPDATYIGITGTNGKSTTTALIAHILKRSGRAIQVGGNLGTPALSFDMLGANGTYVLELSSYQLDLMQKNFISVAVLLNISPDHLSRHGGMKGYVAAKKRIIRKEAPQTLIIGIDDDETAIIECETSEYANLKVIPLSVKQSAPDGVESHNGVLSMEGKKILSLASLTRLPGSHNAQNVGAAYAACRSAGLEQKEIVEAIETFPGLAHRQQFIAERDGVSFINDSKATNADATEKALVCYDTLYWIIGGRAKEGGLSGLEKYASRIRHAFIIGEAAPDFSAWCERNNIAHTVSGTLSSATRAAAQQAVHDKLAHATVLLSPACASWDQFKSFEDRGDQFAAFVHALPKDL